MDKVFVDAYLNLIKQDFSQDYWLKKSRETEQMRKNGELDLTESGIEIEGNSFSADLEEGAYKAYLTGKIGKKTIQWEVSDYNSDFDGPLGIEINGKSKGIIKIGEGQTANMILSNLYEEFKDAFNELDIDEYAEDDQDEDDEEEDWG